MSANNGTAANGAAGNQSGAASPVGSEAGAAVNNAGPTATSIVSEAPSTAFVGESVASPTQANAATNAPTTSAPSVVNVLTTVPASTITGGPSNSQGAQTVFITSTESSTTADTATSESSTSSSASSTKTGSAALATSGASASSGGGLPAGGKIAIAVIVPIVAIAILLLVAICLWRRRKQRKEAGELRRKEVEEYGYNPNQDPNLPPVAGAGHAGDGSEMTQTDGAGYRGWGATSTTRKPSTTLSSRNRGAAVAGMARSGSDSENGPYPNGSPTQGTNKSSGTHSDDPLLNSSPSHHTAATDDGETVGALGGGPSSNNNALGGMHRGPSNASSAYSATRRSELSADEALPHGAPGQNSYNENMFYDDAMPQHGPYGDGTYGGGQPVIRDVPARRNTRIENPSVLPSSGSAGIAQNF